jgi:solute carrier family 45 protein 1/2/4
MAITDGDAADCDHDTREWGLPRGHEVQGLGGQIKYRQSPSEKRTRAERISEMASWAGQPSVKGSTESMRMALLTFSLVGIQ